MSGHPPSRPSICPLPLSHSAPSLPLEQRREAALSRFSGGRKAGKMGVPWRTNTQCLPRAESYPHPIVNSEGDFLLCLCCPLQSPGRVSVKAVHHMTKEWGGQTEDRSPCKGGSPALPVPHHAGESTHPKSLSGCVIGVLISSSKGDSGGLGCWHAGHLRVRHLPFLGQVYGLQCVMST